MAAGQTLKLLRNRRNITVRGVEHASLRIAEAIGDKRFRISNGWLAQLENGASSEPSSCKLFSLSAIYRVKFCDLLRLYNIDISEQTKYELIASPQLTQLILDNSFEPQLHPDASHTPDHAATKLLQNHSNGNSRIVYGHIGSTDLTMYPLIRPNALVEIDTTKNKLQTALWHNEFDRPIFFVELREGYACGWCELQANQLLIIPHHSSPVTVRRFTYPREAEIVGRVVAYRTRCLDSESARDTEQRATSR